MVYSTFIFAGRGRLIGQEEYRPLAHPLYEELLDSDMRSSDDIVNFLAANLMLGSFGMPPDQNEIDFIKTSQEKIRRLLMKATKGNLGVADLSPLSPYREDDIVEANKLGNMGGIHIFTSEQKPVSMDEIKVIPAFKRENTEWVPYDKNKFHIPQLFSSNFYDFYTGASQQISME